MAQTFDGLSDKALSILTFAAYYRLLSGQSVSSVARRDRAGHEADAEGVAELESRGLVSADEQSIALGDEAADFVDTLVDRLRGEVGR